MGYKILVINPGSTSSKLALFENHAAILNEKIVHPIDQFRTFPNLWDQFDHRKNEILAFLDRHGFSVQQLDAVVGRGGLLRPIPGGVYLVNDSMVADARAGIQGQHPSNLGCVLAKTIADMAGIPAFTVDPVSVDEFEPLARYSGHPLIQRRSLAHTLNIHAVGRMAAERLNVDYFQSNFIIAHLGGGISICPLKGGRIIDVNDASSSGPFSPERTGELPLQPFIELCFSGKYTKEQMSKLVMGQGGLVAYLGTNSAEEVEKRIAQGDTKAKEVYEAMAYQIAKEIGAMATVLKGNIRAIVLTGGLAKSQMLTDWVTERVQFIAEVILLPGEFEMEALAEGALRVLEGIEEAKIY